MRNPEITKERILNVSASLFNVQGYKATSLSDITEATGLTKGAIYRHFVDKEDLEASTYDFMSRKIQERIGKVIKECETAPEKLNAICGFFMAYINSPVIAGGCPILNAGVEADDTMPGLNAKVKSLLDSLQVSLETIIQKGVKYGQVKPEVDPKRFATVFIAMMEGAVLLCKVRKSSVDMAIVVDHIQDMINEIKT